MQVYNCLIRAGHDGIEFLTNSSNCRAYNNDIDIRVNTGIRVDNGAEMRLDHNTFYGLHGSGWCCTEMEDIVQVEIDHNIFHDYQGSIGSAAVQPVHASGFVLIHNNVFWNVGPISMGSGSGNIINLSDHSIANWVVKGYGYGSIDELTNSTDQKTPVASFGSSVTSGYAPLSVAFTETSTGTPSSWLWDFGDGTKSTDQNPIHTYSAAGNYTANLTVSNDKGTNSTFSKINVSTQPILLVANFTSNITSGYSPLSVQFNDLSKNATRWNWDFGDGNTSNVENPIHTFSSAKNYTISLTAINGYGLNSKSMTINVTEVMSSNDNLVKLTINSGVLSPAFSSGTTTYRDSVSYSVSSVTITPAAADSNSNIAVNGIAVTSGMASQPINLNVGINTINIVVTAHSSVKKTYTLSVTRAAASNNNNLSGLTISRVTLSPRFSSSTTTYTDNVSHNVSNVTVTSITMESTAIIMVNGVSVTSGRASQTINLNVGTNTIKDIVTAQSGATKTYTIKVTRS